MKQIKLKVTYIQIFFSLSIFVTFLPNGLIYASGKAAQIVRAMYLVQFFIYSVTIFLCAKKSLKLIKGTCHWIYGVGNNLTTGYNQLYKGFNESISCCCLSAWDSYNFFNCIIYVLISE